MRVDFSSRTIRVGFVALCCTCLAACSGGGSAGVVPNGAASPRSVQGGPGSVGLTSGLCATAVFPNPNAGTVQIQASGSLSQPAVALNVNVTSCSNATETVGVHYVVTPAMAGQTCGASDTVAPGGDVSLAAGSTHGFSLNLPVPKCGIPADYNVAANVVSGSSTLASGAAVFHIVMAPFSLTGTVTADPSAPGVTGAVLTTNDGTTERIGFLASNLPLSPLGSTPPIPTNSTVGIYINGQFLALNFVSTGQMALGLGGPSCSGACSIVGWQGIPGTVPVFTLGTKIDLYAVPFDFSNPLAPPVAPGQHLATGTLNGIAHGPVTF